MRGLVLVYTGDGKGKSTAAFGLCSRMIGNNGKVCIIQFLKSPDFPTGEREFFEKNNVEIYACGIGYSWTKTPDEQRASIKQSWEFAKSKLKDSSYDLIILDEINNVLAIKEFEINSVIPLVDVIEVIKNKNEKLNIVLTGRNAKDEIVAIADLVTEMKCIKHYYDNGISAVRGIEY